MGLLAGICFALTLKLSALDPKITFYFSLPGCTPCIEAQIQVVALYANQDDEIQLIRNNDSDKAAADQLSYIQSELKKRKPGLKIVSRFDASKGIGWKWEDEISGEVLSYFSRLGNYDQRKSRDILKMLR